MRFEGWCWEADRSDIDQDMYFKANTFAELEMTTLYSTAGIGFGFLGQFYCGLYLHGITI